MSVVSAANEHGGPGAGAVVAAARPVVLVRYRPGVVGETARTVHMVPLPALPTEGQAGAVGTLCGLAVMLGHIETVILGEGMPCTMCLVNQVMSTVPRGHCLRVVRTARKRCSWAVGPATSGGVGR